jgi:6-phosphogluconate dehydrogenase, C-terminal domain
MTSHSQAQRDLFGAHTFERLDKPGVFHHRGSTTFKRQDLRRGFGPDACCDMQNERPASTGNLDLTGDPPLDLPLSFSAGDLHAVQHPLTRHR